MVNYVITIAYAVALILLGLWIIDCRYYKEKKHNLFQAVTVSKKNLMGLAVFFSLLITAFILGTVRRDEIALEPLLRWVTILCGCYVLAYIDYQEHIIPNKIILVLFLVRIAFLIYEVIIAKEYFSYVILNAILGAAAGAVFMLVGMLISRKGLGMGDVKLFFVIGFYVSSYEVISTMLYTFLLSAIVGIVLLMTKKVSLHDTMPLAPFALGGILIKFMLMIYGG